MSTIICAGVISIGFTGWDTCTGRSINTTYRALDACLLERHDNARLLAKGVARAKRGTSCLRCNGGLWLRFRCEKFWVTWHWKIRVPFPVGRWLTTRH